MPDPDLSLLLSAAEAAGNIALRHFEGDRAATEKPDAQGPVTAADLEVDRALREILLGARPTYGWLSEESEDDPARLRAERAFVVDPIDGTRAFIEGGKAWSHSLAVVENGQPVSAVVHLPRLGRTYAAQAGQGAWLNGQRIQANDRRSVPGARVLVNGMHLNPAYWPGGVPPIEKHFRSSIAYRLCLIGEGRFDAMVTFRETWEWDCAAGDLVVREAGGAVTNREGAPLVFNKPRPLVAGVLAAASGLHERLLERATTQAG